MRKQRPCGRSPTPRGLFEANPTLMRLKELETLEKIAEKAKLSVVLGEKGLVEKVVKMI